VDRDTRLEPQAAAGTEEAPSPDPAPQPRPDRRSVPALMSADPRLTVWIRRAVMALVVGVGLAIWVGWRWGLTGAALVAVLDTLYQSKAMAPVPAEARATSAQRKTRRRLAGLRTSGYVTLNARGIPDSDQQIDHLVVGPSGIYAIGFYYLGSALQHARGPVDYGLGGIAAVVVIAFIVWLRRNEKRLEAEAETVYRADLGLDATLARACQHPGNVWSLHGYHECLARQGKDEQAGIVFQQLKIAAARADVPVRSSCYCRLAAAEG